MNSMLKKLGIILLCIFTAEVSAMEDLGPSDSEEIVEVYVEKGRMLLDRSLFERVQKISKTNIHVLLEPRSKHTLAGLSQKGWREVITHIAALEQRAAGDMQGIFLAYMAAQDHEGFCEFVLAAQALGIEFCVKTAQDFFKRNYRTLIDLEDSTFFTNLLLFQRNRFKALGAINRQEDGETLLTYAAARGKSLIVSTLLASQADPQLVNDEGSTPLIEAAKAESVAVVKQLLGAKVATDCVDQGGMRALDYATMAGNDEMVVLLGGEEALQDLQRFKRKIRADILTRKRDREALEATIVKTTQSEPQVPSQVEPLEMSPLELEPRNRGELFHADMEESSLELVQKLQREEYRLYDEYQQSLRDDYAYAQRIQEDASQNVRVEVSAKMAELERDEDYARGLEDKEFEELQMQECLALSDAEYALSLHRAQNKVSDEELVYQFQVQALEHEALYTKSSYNQLEDGF